MKISALFNIGSLLLFTNISVCSQLQYCAQNEEKKTDMCIAVSSFKNATTNANDLLLSMSVHFHQRRGWAAFGIGEAMSGALMFVMYPGVNEGDVTVSIRSTFGHNPPDKAPKTPDIRIRSTSLSSPKGYHIANLICYNCEYWTDTPVSLVSEKQPWIWSTHYYQQTQSEDLNFPLQLHTDFGTDELNMGASFTQYGEPTAPEITKERVSTHIDSKPRTDPATLIAVHGALLMVSFSLMFFGIISIRSGLAKSFHLHWVLQILASLGIVAGLLVGVMMSFQSSFHRHFNSTHQILGLLFFVGIPIQVFLGYIHHRNFVRVCRRTKPSHFHIWLGRTLWIVGNVNVTLGLKLAGASSRAFRLWYGTIVAETAVLILVFFIWKGKAELMRESDGKSEEEVAFVIADEEESEDEDEKFGQMSPGMGL